MRLLCVGGVADGLEVEFGELPVVNVYQHMPLGNPMDPMPDVLHYEPYRPLVLYFKGVPEQICAVPVRTVRDVDALRLLVARYPRPKKEKLPF